jgi:hypothetical protein
MEAFLVLFFTLNKGRANIKNSVLLSKNSFARFMWSWVKYGQDYWLVIEPRLAPKYLRKIHGIK